MFQRDFVLREVQQLTQVLELVIFKRKSEKVDEAQDVLNGALKDVFDTDVDGIIGLSTGELIELCSAGTHVIAEKAVALAELLEVEADFQTDSVSITTLRAHAWALYSAALHTDGAILPVDINERIASLE